jgi:hypothetical protein
MQFFGKFETVHELEYLTKSYLYIPLKDKNNEDIKVDKDHIDLLLKKRNKTVAGTIFLYNPATAPIGYDISEKLMYQEFNSYDQFLELQIENEVRIIGRCLKKYAGKLVEIKYLFNYNKQEIQPTSVLEIFDMDLEKLQTNLLTVFAKKYNFQDYKNISYNGKFIFFAWGHKFDRHHTNITTYASNIALWAKKLDKEIGFIYDGVKDEEDSFEYTRFFAPSSFGKLKLVIPPALQAVFAQDSIKPCRI